MNLLFICVTEKEAPIAFLNTLALARNKEIPFTFFPESLK